MPTESYSNFGLDGARVGAGEAVQVAERFPGIEASALVAGPDSAGMPCAGQYWGSLCPGEIFEEVEDERVGLVRCFQRDEMRCAGDFDVTGVR